MNIVVDNLMIKYEDSGHGPVLLLLHGWGSDLKAFDTLSERLSKKYRVIRLGLPGFGGSDKPSDDWFVGDYANFLADFIKKLKIDNLYAVIGHSFGGRITIKAVGNGLLKPKKIILLGAAGIKHSNSLRSVVFGLFAKIGKVIFKLPLLNKFAKSARKKLYKAAGSTDYINSAQMKQIFHNAINEDLKSFTAKIKVPSLLIWGENDIESPIADAKVFNGLIENSKLVVIPNAGHFVYIDAFEATMQEINKFL